MVIPAFFQSRPLQAVAFIASYSIDYGLHRAEDTYTHFYDLIMSIWCGVCYKSANAQKIKFKYANYLLLDGGVSHSGPVMP